MTLTKVSGGILQQPIDVGIITATSIQVGSGTTIHDAGIDLGSGNITSHNINSTGIVTSTGLDVNGNGDISGDLSVSGNVSIGGTLTYEDVTNIDSIGVVTARNGLHVTSGSVGFGTDNPATDFHIHSPSSGSNSEILLTNGDTGVAATDGFKIALNAGSGGEIWNYENDYIRFGTNNDEKIRIESGGFVGLGTNNPYHELHIQGSGDTRALITSGGTGDAVMMFENASGNTWGHGIDLTNNNYVIAYNSTSDPSLTADGKVEITTAGNIGIGTDNPQANLHIFEGTGSTQAPAGSGNNLVVDGSGEVGMSLLFGTSANTAYGNIYWGNSTDGPSDGRITYFGSTYATASDRQSMQFRTAGTERLRIKSDGDVYIGNIAHSNEGGANSSYRTLTLTDTTNGAQLHLRGQSPKLFMDVTSSGNAEIYYDTGDLRILSGEPGGTPSERLRIKSDGHVGIATNNPLAKLHVHGGTNDTPAYFDTSNANGAHIRFLQSGSVRHFLGCGGGISLGDKDDLTMRAYDNIIFATANSSTRKATLASGGEFIVGATSSAAGLVHAQHNAITAAAPSLGWPHYVADTDANAKTVLHLETAGNGNVTTAGQGATVVLSMGQYYDSRAVITTRAAGGGSPSDQGQGHGKDLLVKGGRSDNANNRKGGRLFLNGGSGYNSNAYDTNYGHCIIQGLGGNVGINQTDPSRAKLHVVGPSTDTNEIIAKFKGGANADSEARIALVSGYSDTANDTEGHVYLAARRNGSGNSSSFSVYCSDGGTMTERFKVTNGGHLYLNGSNGTHRVVDEYTGSTSVTGTNTESFAFEFIGSSLASGGLLYFWGTSGNVVVNVSAEILVNHSADVTIKSMSGAYTQGRIRVKTDNNTRCAVYLGRSGGYASGTTTLNWRFIPYGGTYAYTTESSNTGTDHTHNTSSGSFRISAAGGGGGNVNASGSKNFLIDHPLVGLATTTRLAHAAVEGPECNTMYRGKVDLVDGTASVNIDTNSRMTEGTFEALNQNVQCFTTNETGWTAIKGSVSGNLLTITAQDNTCTDTISWMVVGERKDQDIINNIATDSEGRFIPEITDEYDPSQFPIYPEES